MADPLSGLGVPSWPTRCRAALRLVGSELYRRCARFLPKSFQIGVVLT